MYSINELDSQQLTQWQAEGKDFDLIDVRSVGEIMAGIIEGGLAMPLNQIPREGDNLPKDKPVVFYCRTGARSAQATAYMAARGYTQVYNLRGGIMDWARQGNAIVAPPAELFGQPANAPQTGMPSGGPFGGPFGGVRAG